MLRQVRAVVPRRFFVIVLADRGLYARWLFQRIVRLGWHPTPITSFSRGWGKSLEATGVFRWSMPASRLHG
jgi:hypothetical protein